jgi:tRNA(fMet)-specific endonuclease VapC
MADKSALIDTDIIISILRREGSVYQRSLDYLNLFGRYKISCITYYECLRGYKAIGANKKINIFNDFLSLAEIIYLNQDIIVKACECYSLLKPKGLLRGEFDLLIGSTALVNDLIIITNNEKHYTPISTYFGLKIENWSDSIK